MPSIPKKIGKKNSPEYAAWCNMRWRCEHEENYLGQNITVCEHWKSYENFVDDMGAKPFPKHTLDRINGSAGYSKENCRWADRSTQAINQKLRETNKTGYRGVSVEKRSGLYLVTVWKNYYMQYVGRYKDPKKAALAYDIAAIQIHGDDAKLNILGATNV